MATSGIKAYTLTASEIIESALQRIGVLGGNESVSAEDMSTGLRELNLTLKNLQTKGLNLWTRNQAFLFPTTSSSYTLTSGGSRWSQTISNTTLSADESLGSTSLDVVSSAGFSVSDNIGIEISGALEWTTVSAIPDSTHITIASGLSAAASSGARVYGYTSTPTYPPVRVIDVVNYDPKNKLYIPSKLRPLTEWNQMSNKDTSGNIASMYAVDYQTDAPTLKIWPKFDDVGYILQIDYQDEIEDITASSQHLDVPRYWLPAIVDSLSVRLAPIFNKELKVQQLLLTLAANSLDDAMRFETEGTSLKFSPLHYPRW